jgi:hypothetical protein
MLHWVHSLDQLLRGELTQMSALRKEGLKLPLRGTTVLLIVLGVIYGICMGSFALLHTNGENAMQMVASAVKVPALFLLTLLVTFPSLYVFNAMVGSQLRFMANLRLLVAGLAVTLAVLASFGPITAFFSVSTTSYPFMKLLNVLAFAVAGGLGMMFLLQTLHRMTIADPLPARREPAPLTEPTSPTQPEPMVVAEAVPLQRPFLVEPRSAIDAVPGVLLGDHVKTVFRCWAILFGLVGAQMGWVLRPFIGSPNQPFSWFRPRQSNFFENIITTISALFG